MRPRRRWGCLTTLAILAVVAVLAYGLNYAADALLYAPWAHGIFGRATLTGNWTGTLRTLEGRRYAIYLELSRSGQALTGRNAPDIDARLSWCTRGVPSASETLQGTSDRSASNIRLHAYMSGHPHAGLIPSDLQGAWHGATLELRVLFTLYNGRTYIYSSAVSDEETAVPLTMHKRDYSAYQSVCAALGG